MLKAAQVGLGWWGCQVTGVLEDSDKIEIVCGVDPANEVARKYGDEFGLPVYSEYQQALDDPSVDGVILTIPHLLHEEAVVQAAAAGKQVFCEKPLALSVDSARRMIAACDDAGVVLGIGHERRFEPAWEEMKRMADSGEFGTILHVEAHWSHDRWRDMAADNWRGSKEESPAAGWTGMGVHLSDMMLSLAGEVVEVQAYVERRILEIPSGDVVSAHFRFADGTTGHVAALSATPDYARFAVFGSQAWAEARETQHVDPGGTTHFYVRRRGDVEQTRTTFEPAGPVRAGYEHWADAVAGRADYRFSNSERLGNIAILEALVRSAESGRPETVTQYGERPPSVEENEFPDFIKALPQPIRIEGDAALEAHLSSGDRGLVMFYEVTDHDIVVPEHVHGDQWGIVLSGTVKMQIGDEVKVCHRGDTYSVPGGVPHITWVEAGTRGLDIFEEYDRYLPAPE